MSSTRRSSCFWKGSSNSRRGWLVGFHHHRRRRPRIRSQEFASRARADPEAGIQPWPSWNQSPTSGSLRSGAPRGQRDSRTRRLTEVSPCPPDHRPTRSSSFRVRRCCTSPTSRRRRRSIVTYWGSRGTSATTHTQLCGVTIPRSTLFRRTMGRGASTCFSGSRMWTGTTRRSSRAVPRCQPSRQTSRTEFASSASATSTASGSCSDRISSRCPSTNTTSGGLDRRSYPAGRSTPRPATRDALRRSTSRSSTRGRRHGSDATDRAGRSDRRLA